MHNIFSNFETRLMAFFIALLAAFLAVNITFSKLIPQAISLKQDKSYLNDRYSFLVESNQNSKITSINNKELISY